jgi:hypothetical protein
MQDTEIKELLLDINIILVMIRTIELSCNMIGQ